MSKRKISPFILQAVIFLFSIPVFSQHYAFQESLNWQITEKRINLQQPQERVLWLKGAFPSAGDPLVPEYTRQFALEHGGAIRAEFTEAEYAEVTDPVLFTRLLSMPDAVKPQAIVQIQAGKPLGLIWFVPFRKNTETGKIERLQRFSLTVTQEPALSGGAHAKMGANSSKLAAGTWYKIGVTETGVYKLDKNFLQGVGIDQNADARNIQLYGKPGGMLPMANNAPRDEDLVENAIEVKDINGNNRIDNEDYILFYAKGPVVWKYDAVAKKFRHEVNYYSDTSYYFVTVGDEHGKRIALKPSETADTYTEVTKFDAYAYHHQDMLNDIKRDVNSGREWYGEEFHSLTGAKTIDKDFSFNIPQVDPAEDIYVRAGLVARSGVNSSFQFFVSGQEVLKAGIGPADVGNYLGRYATHVNTEKSFRSSNSRIDIKVRYNVPPAEASGWLDFIELNTRAQLKHTGGQFGFRDQYSVQAGATSRYHIMNGNANLQVWDVTDFHSVKKQAAQLQGNELVFAAKGDQLREYIAFDGGFLMPKSFGRVNNQDLHNLDQPDMVIVAHQRLLQAANKLADFHRQHDGFTVHVVTPLQIYNEFSSGTQDISAIRDFMRMFYQRGLSGGKMPGYLLLFGDASWDYKYRTDKNTNLVPTYESLNSLDPLATYCADDYFGFLDDSEGNWDLGNMDLTDIAIGRIPVNTPEEAETAVNKILKYHEPAALNDWRNVVTFIADDQDGNVHFEQSEQISKKLESETKVFNIRKIYLDAYKQEVSSSGARYPAAQRDLINAFEQGSLVINYLGHGGEVGLAHEKIVEVADLQGLKNFDRMPLFVTATCEFSRFDDPYRIAAGEYAFLNPKGGAISMFTTTRIAWIGTNERLNEALLIDNLLKKENGKAPRIGDVCMKAKNAMNHVSAIRSFTLLGDPAMRLAIPEDQVAVTSINGKPVHEGGDTLRALELATMTGEVREYGQQSADQSFDGTVDVTIYDKKTTKTTLGNDPESAPQDFQVRESVIYKGRASVADGKFTLHFVVPKDISFQKGFGRISAYARDKNANRDAHGNNDSVIVGGSSHHPVTDNEGPQIQLFMNDTTFLRGGLVNENPVLIARLRDDIGINTTGSGIGHDISVSLNGGTPIILNQYYQAALDDYRRGEVRYPFHKLADGHYTVTLKAWDVSNNSGTASTEFIVASSAKLALDRLFNFPNPVADKTTFHFEHNKPDEDFKVFIDIYTLSGKRVKALSADFNSEGSTSSRIEWDGRGDSGADIANGMYLYTLTLKTADGDIAQQSQKLVVIR